MSGALEIMLRRTEMTVGHLADLSALATLALRFSNVASLRARVEQ